MVIDAQAASRFETGSRVFHQKFGYGLITGIEGDKLTVAFEKAGEKKVVASYVAKAEKPCGADDVPFGPPRRALRQLGLPLPSRRRL